MMATLRMIETITKLANSYERKHRKGKSNNQLEMAAARGGVWEVANSMQESKKNKKVSINQRWH